MDVKASIIIATRRRPDSLQICLEHLSRLASSDFEVIVVDSSEDQLSYEVVKKFTGVQYIKSSRQNTPFQRNLGLAAAQGEIVCYLDDDSYADEQWLNQLLLCYKNPEVAAVGGRFIDEDSKKGVDGIVGYLRSDGFLSGNFTFDSKDVVEVDHMIGANMSFRRSALQKIKGFDTNYAGNFCFEETDPCVRLKQAGGTILYNPRAVVRHVRAKRVAAQRGTLNYRGLYYYARNYAYFILKNFPGDFKKMFFLFIRESYWQVAYFFRDRDWPSFVRIFINAGGKIAGTFASFKPREVLERS